MTGHISCNVRETLSGLRETGREEEHRDRLQLQVRKRLAYGDTRFGVLFSPSSFAPAENVNALDVHIQYANYERCI